MAGPLKPRLMARVLDAIASLANTKGSSAREVLDFIQRSNVSSRNLTLQVQRALKHAVNAGLLRHRSGRYKVLAILNPVLTPVIPAKEPADDDKNVEGKELKSRVRPPTVAGHSKFSRRTQERKEKATLRRQAGRRRSSDIKSKSQDSSCTKRANEASRSRKRQQRKRAYDEDEEFEEQLSGRYVMYERDESAVPFNRRAKRSRVGKRELESDLSEESDRECHVSSKRASRASTSLRLKPKRKERRAKSKGGSASRARNPQRIQARQGIRCPIKEVQNVRQRCDKDCRSTEHSLVQEEAREDAEGARESTDSNRDSSTPENS